MRKNCGTRKAYLVDNHIRLFTNKGACEKTSTVLQIAVKPYLLAGVIFVSGSGGHLFPYHYKLQ